MVSGLPTVDVPSRKLRGSDLEKAGIKTSLSEEDGKTPTRMYFPMVTNGKVTGYYVKTISKPSHLWAIGEVKNAEPFGWQDARRSGAYRLIIVEGLEDRVAVEKIYRTYESDEYQPAVISLPNGVKSVRKSLAPIAEDIKKTFKEVILCYDNDPQGQAAVDETMLLLPLAKSVTLPCKDANACIIEGYAKAAFKALKYHSVVPKNTRIVMGDSLHELARHPTPYGELTWPWPSLNKLLRGIRYGETIYLGAGVKMGKSEILNAICAHFIKEHNVPVFVAKPEESNIKTYKLICNKMVGDVFHDPDTPFDFAQYDKAGEMLKGKLMMIDLYQHMGWESLKKDIIVAASMGAKAVFIDPITNLTNGLSASDANTKLQDIAQDLASMAHDLNIVIFIFCHLKAPEGNIAKDIRLEKYKRGEYTSLGNCPHELGGDVLSSQFAGSRAMMRSCNLMIGIEGNKDPLLDDTQRRMRVLSILEDREFGNSSKVRLIWNPKTTLFTEG